MDTPRLGYMFPCRFPVAELAPFATTGEQLGFDELWVVEDCFFAGGIATATAALSMTREITVGLGIVPAVARNAAFTAMEFGAVAELFPGRFLAGIGHGVPDWMRQIGSWPRSPLTALEETFVAVRELLAGESVTVDGEHVRLRNVQLEFPPTTPPPVYAGVRGPKSLAVAGRAADGTVLAEPSSPAFVAAARERLTNAGALATHQIAAYAWLSVDDDLATARERLRPSIAATLFSPAADAQLEPLGYLDEIRATRDACADSAAFATAVRPAWIDDLAVVGPPETCADRLRALAAAGADSVVFVPPLETTPAEALAQLTIAGTRLLPLARG